MSYGNKNLNDLAYEINQIAKDHGFWETDRNFGEMIALAHSELSEALEEYRDGKEPVYYLHVAGCAVADHKVYGMQGDAPNCTCTPKPEGMAVELVDCIIRCLDTLYSLDVNIDSVVQQKMEYNRSRPYKHNRKF